MKIFKVLSVVAIFLVIHSCTKVPVTGRRQLDLVSSAEINTMSATQYQEVVKKGPVEFHTGELADERRRESFERSPSDHYRHRGNSPAGR